MLYAIFLCELRLVLLRALLYAVYAVRYFLCELRPVVLRVWLFAVYAVRSFSV